jgi:hypothetical protein
LKNLCYVQQAVWRVFIKQKVPLTI